MTFDPARFGELRAERGLTLGEPLVFAAVTGSTNDDALEAARAGAPQGATFVADLGVLPFFLLSGAFQDIFLTDDTRDSDFPILEFENGVGVRRTADFTITPAAGADFDMGYGVFVD